jgi:hypothetical protein
LPWRIGAAGHFDISFDRVGQIKQIEDFLGGGIIQTDEMLHGAATSAKNWPKIGDECVDFCTFYDQGWQQAQGLCADRADQVAGIEASAFDLGSDGLLELDAQHQAGAADFVDQAAGFSQLLQFLPEMVAQTSCFLDQVADIQCLEDSESCGTGQGVATKGAPWSPV